MKRRPNWSLVGGFVMGLAIVFASVFHSTSTPWIFVNIVGFLIVAGGMLAASFIIYSVEDLADLMGTVKNSFLQTPASGVKAIQEIVHLSSLQAEDPLFFNWKLDWIEHALIRDGVELLSIGLKPDEIKRRLEVIADYSQERALKHSGVLLSLAKLGPGFGLLGTLVGLVVLLQDMGSTGNFDNVGPALGISLLATLYGTVAANLFLQPLSEFVRNRGEHGRKIDQAIIDGILMLKDQRHPLQIRDGLRTYLTWKENLRLEDELKTDVREKQREEAA